MLNLTNFREERGITSAQVVSVMREQYSGYDKYLNSKVERPEKYGVRLVNDAERLLEEAFTKTVEISCKRDRRKLPCRIQCRMTRTKFERLQQALKREGFDTVQAGIAHVIDLWLEGRQ